MGYSGDAAAVAEENQADQYILQKDGDWFGQIISQSLIQL